MQMRKEQHSKGWNEIKTNDSWAIFKIMGEFVNGFEKMKNAQGYLVLTDLF